MYILVQYNTYLRIILVSKTFPLKGQRIIIIGEQRERKKEKISMSRGDFGMYDF